jgi:hypothetical protein
MTPPLPGGISTAGDVDGNPRSIIGCAGNPRPGAGGGREMATEQQSSLTAMKIGKSDCNAKSIYRFALNLQ